MAGDSGKRRGAKVKATTMKVKKKMKGKKTESAGLAVMAAGCFLSGRESLCMSLTCIPGTVRCR